MVLDDVDELGDQHLEGRGVSGHVHVAVDRVEEPEGGVGGVVEPLGPPVGEEVGDQAVADVVGEGAEDVAGLVVPPGRQGQPFEADHGVAAPVGEPVVAGDDGADLLARGMRPSRVHDAPDRGDQELVGRQDQLGGGGVSRRGSAPGRATGRGGCAPPAWPRRDAGRRSPPRIRSRRPARPPDPS